MKGGMCDGNGTCNLGGVVHVTLQLPRQARLVLHACQQMQTFLCNLDVRMKSKNACASSLVTSRIRLACGQGEPVFATTAPLRSEPVASFPVRIRSY